MKDQMAENVSISRIVDSVPLCVIRKASNADAKLPARHRASANGGGGYLLRNQMRLYEIYDGENWCREETDAKDIGIIKTVNLGFGDSTSCSGNGFSCNTTDPLECKVL